MGHRPHRQIRHCSPLGHPIDHEDADGDAHDMLLDRFCASQRPEHPSNIDGHDRHSKMFHLL